MNRTIITLVVVVFIASCAPTSVVPETDPVIISVLGTNDVHGELIPQSNRGGITTFSGYVAAVRDARADDGAVLLVDAGDMWQNRFGNCTSIRINSENIEQVKNNLSQIITPKQLGITFTNIKQNANIAVNQSVDFSELFFGLSFFMI